MCGIVGQARTDGAPVRRDLLERMCAGLEHRGPDSRGIHLGAGAGLGIQRLRVIDLDTGDQPIYNEDGTVAVVLNGEIYNFQELRAGLENRGHRFATRSDTEVIVHLYEELGPACVGELAGMFGLAIWDSRARQLTLARDRLGKKPLLYAERDGALSFASEFRALLQDQEIARDIDHRAIDGFLAYEYVPAPATAFRAIRKLPPASVLVYRDGKSTISRYWELDYSQSLPLSGEELRLELRERIARAVRRRLISDVPLGAFLSGGIDSATVVAAMAEASAGPVKTFTIGFESERFNEMPGARLIAQHFGTDHHELVVRPNAVEMIPKLVRHYGEPFADPSAVPSFYLAEMARKHVTVALNGDGGDEAFGGYQRYTTNNVAHRLDVMPGGLRRAIARMAGGQNGDRRGNGSGSARRRVARLAGSLALAPDARYIDQISSFAWSQREALYSDDYRASVDPDLTRETIAEPWRRSSGASIVDVMLDVDTRTYLPDDLLVKMDIATMAHSLEARSPLLDHELLEFAASLPRTAKVRGRDRKVSLRDAMRGVVPDATLDGPKRGFQLPVDEWFRGELREFAGDILLDGTARGRGYFRPSAVSRLIDQHVAGTYDHSRRLWSLVMLEMWQREFIDAPLAAAA